jgi:glycosyltransferase involved in cell wall biosynthesis
LIRKKYNLPENFILYFGTLEPRKNLVGLIQSYEIFRRQTGSDKKYSLVLAGNSGWLCDDIFVQARKSDFAQDIIFAGFVDPADKIYLYNLASLFVYPSFFEGFGFPPLEAMACGVPVICSHTSSFPEVVSQAALTVDPYNFDEIAWAMKEVLTDKELGQDLVKDGLIRAKNFSWDKCARETLDYLTN